MTCGETCGDFALVKFTTPSPQVLSSVTYQPLYPISSTLPQPSAS